MHMACIFGRVDTVEVLLNAATLNEGFWLPDHSGKTALDYATENAIDAKIVGLFLARQQGGPNAATMFSSVLCAIRVDAAELVDALMQTKRWPLEGARRRTRQGRAAESNRHIHGG